MRVMQKIEFQGKSSPNDSPNDLDYDVVVVGGSIAGASVALMLAQRDANLRVLVIENQETLGRRVGESTVELSTYFFTRVLGLTRYLNETQINKQGFRFWFMNDDAQCMSTSTEMGGKYLSRVGSFQIDREEVDAEIMRRGVERGVELWRPARVRKFDLKEGGTQTLTVKVDGEEREIRCRWVVDATGRQAALARHRDTLRPVDGHPNASVWARFRGTLDFDSPELMAEHPALMRGFFGTRNTATNHLIGDGWWAWIIPLKNGDTSIGVTWDKRYFEWPRQGKNGESGTLTEQLVSVVNSHPVGRRVIRDAEWIEGDIHILKNLSYVSDGFAGDGFTQVGDAAGFIDPFYSMGLDAMAMTAMLSVDLILAQQSGQCIQDMLVKHNTVLRNTYDRWNQAIYRNKYAYMGDFELMRAAFLNDIGLYYFGLVMPPYRSGGATLKDGMFHGKIAQPFFWYIRWVNRRLAAMGTVRRQRGTFGRKNAKHRMLIPGFAFDSGLAKTCLKVVWLMFKLELTEGWRSWRPAKEKGEKTPDANENTTPS
ncbi:MAG: NAD(P)/FAD-dependent oxidoreductase [Algisphaera sp.]